MKKHHKIVSHCLNANNTLNISAACKADEPCLMDDYTYCRHAGKREHRECMKANSSHFSTACKAEMAEREDDCKKGKHGRKPRWHMFAMIAAAALAIIACVCCIVRRRSKVRQCSYGDQQQTAAGDVSLPVSMSKEEAREHTNPVMVVATPATAAYSPPNEHAGARLLPIASVQEV
jgi:hypothetical protein